MLTDISAWAPPGSTGAVCCKKMHFFYYFYLKCSETQEYAKTIDMSAQRRVFSMIHGTSLNSWREKNKDNYSGLVFFS